MKLYQQTHEKVELIDCFSNIGLHYESLLPIKIRTKPCIMIMKKKKGSFLAKDLVYEDESTESPGNLLEEKDTEDDVDLDDSDELLRKEEEILEEQLEILLENSGNLEDNVETSVNLEEKSENQESSSGNEEEEDEIPFPKVKRLRKRKLIKPVENPKQRIKEIIEAEKEDEIENKKKVVTKELLDEISKLDLREYCDLDKIDKKDCLKRIIDENDI